MTKAYQPSKKEQMKKDLKIMKEKIASLEKAIAEPEKDWVDAIVDFFYKRLGDHHHVKKMIYNHEPILNMGYKIIGFSIAEQAVLKALTHIGGVNILAEDNNKLLFRIEQDRKPTYGHMLNLLDNKLREIN